MLELNPLNYQICFSVPRRLTSFSAWHEHIPFALFLVDVLKPKMIVELGTQYGDSYCAFCQAVKELNLNTKCYAIDTWQGDPHAGLYGPEVLADLRAHHDSLYGDFSCLIQSTFDEALQHFTEGTIDLLNIDGYHTYESVKHDFELWLPKMSSRGVVLFHDINVRKENFGVWKLWDEIKLKYPHFEFLHGYGLGVLAVDKASSSILQALFDTTASNATIIRNFFFQLGRQLTLNNTLPAKDLQIRNLEASLEEKSSHITELVIALQTKNLQICDLNNTLQAKDVQINELSNALQAKDVQVAERDAILTERDTQITSLTQTIHEREGQIVSLNQTVAERDGHIDALYSSRSWKLTSPLRWGGRQIRRALLFHRAVPLTIRHAGGVKSTAKLFHKINRLMLFMKYAISLARSWKNNHGHLPSLREMPFLVRKAWYKWRSYHQNDQEKLMPPPGFELPPAMDPYDAWLEVNQWNSRRERLLRQRLSQVTNPPLISVIMPVYNPPIKFLEKAINSVREQVYENWELCIADDACADNEIRSVLRAWSEKDKRIVVCYRDVNGNISKATNSAAALAKGDYLLFLDHDDELTTDALAEVAVYICQHPKTDILYSDDDKIDTDGKRFAPQFKPDWSPELLLSYMYFSHLFVIRRSLFEELGGMREGFEGSQDYDLALRATENVRHVGHIPKVLYHWRVLPGSTASSGAAKPSSIEAGRRVVEETLKRRGINAKVTQPDWAIQAKCGIYELVFPDDGPSVTILIPTRNNVKVLKKCLKSLRLTTYKNYEIVIIDNESDDPETLEYLKQVPFRVIRIPNEGGHFNFAAINNQAVAQMQTDYVLFLNDDTEVRSPRWLSQMVGYLGIPCVGAVGARPFIP